MHAFPYSASVSLMLKKCKIPAVFQMPINMSRLLKLPGDMPRPFLQPDVQQGHQGTDTKVPSPSGQPSWWPPPPPANHLVQISQQPLPLCNLCLGPHMLYPARLLHPKFQTPIIFLVVIYHQF